MTDAEKHEWCLRRTGHPAVFLPPSLYDAAERAGCDMRLYVRTRLIPRKNFDNAPWIAACFLLLAVMAVVSVVWSWIVGDPN